MEGGLDYREKLKIKMDSYVHRVYAVTRNFPKEELYGAVSQLRRAALSVILNFVEGYARKVNGNEASYRYFLNISYGSLKESKYLIDFSLVEKFISKDAHRELVTLADEIGAMLYCIKGFIINEKLK